MDQNKESAPVETKETTKADKAPSQKYTLSQLRAHCLKLFGVTQSGFDGATAELSGEFTIDELKKKIEAWMGKKIEKKKEAK